MTRQRQRQGGNDQKLNIILGMQIVILLILIISIAMIQETPNVEIVGQLIGSGPDSDGDGFSDLHEQYLGTNPNSACPSTSTPNDEAMDAWPPDFNDDRQVTLTDLTSFLVPVRHLNTNPGDPNYNYRWDLIAGRGVFTYDINIQDLTALLVPVRYLNTACGPPTPTTLPTTTTRPTTTTTTTTVTVPFNFTVSVPGSLGNVARGSNTSVQVSVVLRQGTPQAVFLALHSFSPPNAGMISTTFLPNFCTPNTTCTVIMHVNINSTAPTGTYSLLIRGSGGGTSVYNSTTLTVF